MQYTGFLQKGAMGVAIIGTLALAYIGMIQLVGAETTTNDVTVASTDPTVGSLSLNTSSVYSAAHLTTIDLTENTTTTYYTHVQFTDANGCSDVVQATAGAGLGASNNNAGILLIGPGKTSATCPASIDPLDCYASTIGLSLPASEAVGSCTTTCADASATTTATITCEHNLQHFSDNGEVVVYASLTDEGNNVTSTVTTTINVLTALDINTTTVGYGSVATGATSSEQTVTITNTGNDTVDFNLSSTDLACDAVGSISASAQEVSTTTGFAYGAGTSVSTTASLINLNLNKQSSTTTASTDGLYWMLQVPTGVSGTCSSTATITAISG